MNILLIIKEDTTVNQLFSSFNYAKGKMEKHIFQKHVHIGKHLTQVYHLCRKSPIYKALLSFLKHASVETKRNKREFWIPNYSSYN